MSEITLGGHTYILEAIEDTEASSHDYDATLDVSAGSSVEELDQWFEKVEAEWESLPKEIQEKITDKMMELADRLAEKTEGNSDVLPVDEATDSQGNEIFDHASGLKRFLSLDKEGIEYSFDDITKAIDAAENIARSGNRAPKLGYYWDEYWALLDAIKIRKQKGETFNLKPWALSAK